MQKKQDFILLDGYEIQLWPASNNVVLSKKIANIDCWSDITWPCRDRFLWEVIMV